MGIGFEEEKGRVKILSLLASLPCVAGGLMPAGYEGAVGCFGLVLVFEKGSYSVARLTGNS